MTELPRMRRVVARAVTLISPKTIKITFPYSSKDVGNVKTLSSRKYHPDPPKHWTAPLCIESVEKLQKWGFELSSDLKEFLTKSKLHVNDVQEVEVPGLKMKLFPFQKKGVSFANRRKGEMLNGDEMGLGKTAQTLAYFQLYPKLRPIIIVCPAHLKFMWQNEIQKWLSCPNIHTQIISGQDTEQDIIGDISIINYDILPELTEKQPTGRMLRDSKTGEWIIPEMKRVVLKGTGWGNKLGEIKAQILVLDEAHYIKNNKASRTKAVKKLAKKIPGIFALSGTLIINRPEELYNAINLVDPTLFPSAWKFKMRYCGAYRNKYGWVTSGASNTKELHDKLVNTIMIRRLKKDVLSELPPKRRSILPLQLDNQKEYRTAEDDFLTWLKEEKGEEAAKRASQVQALAKIEALKQLTIKGKMKQCIEWIENFLDSNGKLVVFCTHRKTVNDLMEKFGEIAVKVDGSVTGLKRQQAVDRFQSDEQIRLFVGNIKAAGVGITLTAASSVAFLELGWSPGEHDQAEDRIHRIGQKAQSINIYYLLAAGTIEEKIAKLLDRKRKVLSAVLDGKDVEEASLLSELMEEMK